MMTVGLEASREKYGQRAIVFGDEHPHFAPSHASVSPSPISSLI
jgi:hypothetical protein